MADVNGSVLWRPIDIGGYGAPTEMTIRLGDSLLLTAGSGQTNALEIAVKDSNGQAYRTCNGAAGQRFPVLFDQAGTFNATAILDGVSVGTLVITVVQVDLQAPIACQIGYKRQKDVLVYGSTNGIAFTANDGTLLEVSVKEPTDRGVRLYAKSLQAGTPVIQARLGGPSGTVIAQQEVDEFTLVSQATAYIGVVETFPDGAKLLQTNLEMEPKVENLVVKLHIIIRGVTFEDSTLDKEINTSDFTFDPVSGKWLRVAVVQ